MTTIERVMIFVAAACWGIGIPLFIGVMAFKFGQLVN